MDDLFLNNIGNNFISILEKKNPSVDKDNLSINYRRTLKELFDKHLELLHKQEKLLSLAKSEGDEILMQSALLRLRSHAMSLSSFFDAIADDAEFIIRLEGWPEIPEGYKQPDE